MHAFSHDWIRAFLFEKFGYDVWEMPMCEGCERVAFWHVGETSMCPHCGKHTKNPITVEEYYKKQYNKTNYGKGKKIMEV